MIFGSQRWNQVLVLVRLGSCQLDLICFILDDDDDGDDDISIYILITCLNQPTFKML